MSIAGAVSSMLARHGQAYTLKAITKGAGANAWTDGAVTAAYNACTARARGYNPNEVRGGIQEGDIKVTIDAATLSTTPESGDWIAAGTHTEDGSAEWWQVVSVYAPQIAGVVTVYKLQARK